MPTAKEPYKLLLVKESTHEKIMRYKFEHKLSSVDKVLNVLLEGKV